MSARSLFTISLVAAGVLAPAAIADAATKASRYPTVSKIEPMRASIGETMTITGKGFLKGKQKNTVVFRRAGRRSIFVKADGTSTTRLSLKVPAKLESALGKKSGAVVATRFQIRVMARRLGKRYTTLSKSPTILPAEAPEVTPLTKVAQPVQTAAAVAPAPAAPAIVNPIAPSDCDSDGQLDTVDVDDDNDLLADTTEYDLETNRCSKDTDGDGMEDGWEFQSATDLNARACPKPPTSTDVTFDYPRPCASVHPASSARPYTNPRFPDADQDYDGDWINAGLEHQAWKRKAAQDPSYYALNGPNRMWYTDGRQSSIDTAPDVPDDNECVGAEVPPIFGGTASYPEFYRDENLGNIPTNLPDLFDANGEPNAGYEIYSLDRDGDGCLNDSERDEDGDFLANGVEINTQMSGPKWWNGVYDEPIFRIVYQGTDWLDANTDDNGPVDGLDDEDFDEFLNIEELYRGTPVWAKNADAPGPTSGLWVDPFNPCLPSIDADVCPIGRPLGQPDAWRPYFEDPNAPEKPRWPLYGSWLYQVSYPTPNWTDPNGPNNPPDQAPMLLGPIERWDGLPANEQTMPALHPLPR